MIVLIGFMGSGKTSVGRRLASLLDLPFVDADEALERDTGKSVSQLFEEEGEEAFRERERELVETLLEGEEAVISLGGGAIEDDAIRAKLGDATVVYLDVSLQEAMRRASDHESRPMLALHDPAELHARRGPLYEDAADLAVATDGTNADEVAEQLARRIRYQASS